MERTRSTWGTHAVLAVMAAIFWFPIVAVVSTSLKTVDEANETGILDLPAHPSLAAWSEAWGRACISGRCSGISVAFANSLEIVLPALVISMTLAAIAGFALSLRISRISDYLLKILLIGLFIPAQVVLIPMIVVERDLGLYGSKAGAILAHVVWAQPFLTMLFRNSFTSIPRSVIGAARLDGASFMHVLRYVVLPLSAPAIAVAAALQFTFLWNEFLLNLTLSGAGNEPLTVALSLLTSAQFDTQRYNVNMAAALIAVLPTLVVYLASGQVFVKGVTTGPRKE
jgi:glucose/mannose transport system permease protein